MAVLVIAEVPGGDDPERSRAFEDGTAAGCRLRLAGPIADGRRVVTFWESREAFELWRDQQLAPALKATGQPVPRIDVWEIDDADGV